MKYILKDKSEVESIPIGEQKLKLEKLSID